MLLKKVKQEYSATGENCIAFLKLKLFQFNASLNGTISKSSHWKWIPIPLKSNSKALDDWVVFLGTHVSSVPTTMVQIYWDADVILANHPKAEDLH